MTDTIKMPSNHTFGLFFSAVFLLIGGWCFLEAFILATYISVGIATSLFITTLVCPRLLAKPNHFWMTFGLLIGKVTNPIFLFLLFSITIFPVWCTFQLTGRDLFCRRSKTRDTMWREPSVNSNDIRKQF